MKHQGVTAFVDRLGGSFRLAIIAVAVAIAACWLAPSDAYALASFARQTGLACSQCHISFPELTPLGRNFKLHAFTTSVNNLTEENTSKGSPLSLLEDVPLSVSFQTSVTATDVSQTGAQNPTVEFPQAINFWLAGQITPHFGTMLQLTYTASADTINGDASDIRYVGPDTKLGGMNFVWGIDANNDPTIEDLWNSTPAFGFAYANPDSAGFEPMATTMIDGTLATQVVGGGPYFMLDDHLYGLVEVYRSQHLGQPQPEMESFNGIANPINIQAVAPYWRLAYQQNFDKNNYFELGTYGIYVTNYPGPVSGPTDNYLDLAGDLSYELTLANGDMIVLHGTFIYETINLNQTEPGIQDNLNTFRLDLSYHFGNKLAFTAGPFLTWGTSDIVLYPASVPLTGFSNNSPDNNGFIAQIAYWPWQNFEIGLQYRAFLMFNGASSNYDGAGRNASDNNTAYFFIWLNY